MSASRRNYHIEIKWLNVFVLLYLHVAAIYGFYLVGDVSWRTIIIGAIFGIHSGFGTTVAAHRYYTHRCFKANALMKFLLITNQTVTCQEPVIHWSRDHRVHHKFTDTDADPYNSRRGFFFAHIGWLMCRKHPDVIEKGKRVDMSDLEGEWYLQVQKKFFIPFAIFLNFVLPMYIGCCLLGESPNTVWHTNIFRYVILLNATWSVNSVAHLWGPKPYDRSISPTDTLFVGILAMGEGYHNYHHIFPWDYKTGEYSGYRFNISTAYIDFFAWLGFITDLKTVPEEVIKKRVLRTGDGSHQHYKRSDYVINNNNNDHNNNNNHISNGNGTLKNKLNVHFDDDETRDTEHFWGFGDNEMTSADMKYVKVLCKTE